MATDGISSGQVSLAVHNSVPSDIFDGLLTLESRWRTAPGTKDTQQSQQTNSNSNLNNVAEVWQRCERVKIGNQIKLN